MFLPYVSTDKTFDPKTLFIVQKTFPPLFNRDKRQNTIQFTGLSPLNPACKVLLRQDKTGLIPSNTVII